MEEIALLLGKGIVFQKVISLFFHAEAQRSRSRRKGDKPIFSVPRNAGEIGVSLCKSIVCQEVTSLFFLAEDAEVTSLLFCVKTRMACFQKRLSLCIPSLDGVRGNTVITHSRLGFLRRDKSFFSIFHAV